MITGTKAIQAITPKDLLVFLCLRRYRNDVTGESSVPISKIVKQTGASPVTVLGCIDRLQESGHILCKHIGRNNVYSFLSDIEAESYAFLDSDSPFQEKAAMAVKKAYVKDSGEGGSDCSEDRLYSYVVGLEEKVAELSSYVRTMAEELDKTRKLTSVITGTQYVPFKLDFNL